MEIQNSKKDKKLLITFKDHLQPDENPITTVLLNQGFRFQQVLLTNKRLLIAKLNAVGRPTKIQSFTYGDMQSSTVTTGKKQLITFNWNNGDGFTAEFEANQIEQVRQIASTFPAYEEIQMRRSQLEKIELFGWGLFVVTALVAFGFNRLFEIQVSNVILMLLFATAFLMIGGAIIIRKENIRGHIGWNAVVFGILSLLLGLFFLFGLLRFIF